MNNKHSHRGDWPLRDFTERTLQQVVRDLLRYVGEDPDREGLRETPDRFLKALMEMTEGYTQDPAAILKCFEDGSESYDELVLQKDLPFYSSCEHHLATFFGVAHIAYIPDGRVVGLSKLGRLLDIFARRLQVQERLTVQIADALQTHLKPKGVGVVIEATHTCICARGVKKTGSTTTTVALRGVFREKLDARAELMSLIGKR